MILQSLNLLLQEYNFGSIFFIIWFFRIVLFFLISRKNTIYQALAAIELWMYDFYAVAKIALDDKVKLMKALKS